MSHMKHQIMWSECASREGGRQLYWVLRLLSILLAAESFHSAKSGIATLSSALQGYCGA